MIQGLWLAIPVVQVIGMPASNMLGMSQSLYHNLFSLMFKILDILSRV